MNRLKVVIERVQHIQSMQLDLDLTLPRLICLVGRNGAGKTTLVRALRNLTNADTFIKTAPPRIFSEKSKITYLIDDVLIVFEYDVNLRALNCRTAIPAAIREALSVELPIPYGARFNFAKSASAADDEIRRALALGTANQPKELVEFLDAIYQTGRYAALIEVMVKRQRFYAIAHPDNTYIREDYLSSGEHFLINLYRAIKSPAKLIVIDEIDLSLDAAAQARLAGFLRGFCERYGCTILFTTHSLAIMQTLDASELFFLDNDDGLATTVPASYSYVRARLFGFKGWDRYILTEDKVLMSFLDFLIRTKFQRLFFSWKIIYIGGGSQVADLLARNRVDGFLGRPENVIAILDGDRQGQFYSSMPGVHLIPMRNIEAPLYELWQHDADFPFKSDRNSFTSDKDFFNYLQQKRLATSAEIFEYLLSKFAGPLEPLVRTLAEFLEYPSQ
jgi:ABC-type Mn2+/Zn2+ transport system ATPase subunit